MSINFSNVNNEVQVREEYGDQRTGGHFAAKSISFTIEECTPGDWSIHDFSFPIPVSLFSAQFIGSSGCGGDEIEFQIAPDTIVGVLTADVAVDDDVITVLPMAWNVLDVGYFMCLDDGVNHDDLGLVLEKQADNKLRVQTPAQHAFAAATPTYVELTVKMVPHGHLPDSSRLVIGDSKIGGTYVHAGTVMRMRYKNGSGSAKKFEFWLEYMY
jgi:hypothetical protein